MSAHHLFLSYSREDNRAPVHAAGEGWVTALVAELKRGHADYSGRELRELHDLMMGGGPQGGGRGMGGRGMIVAAYLGDLARKGHASPAAGFPAVLEEIITAGCQLDPTVMILHVQLERMVSSS